MLVLTKDLASIIHTTAKLIKHPKLSLDAFSQIAFVVKNNNLYVVGLGLSVPNSKVSSLYLLTTNVNMEDNVYFFKDKDIEKVFGTLGDETNLEFTETHLNLSSDNNGLMTHVNILRQKPYSPETEQTILNKLDELLNNPTNGENVIDTDDLIKKLNNLLKFKSAEKQVLTFEPNRVSVQQHSYVAQEPFNFGFTARLGSDEVKVLIQAMRTISNGILEYNEHTGVLRYMSSISYFEITNVKNETYNLDKFEYTDGNHVTIQRTQLASALNLISNYVDNYSNMFIVVEDNQLVLTTTINKDKVKNLSVPVIKLPITDRGSKVENRDYGLSLSTLKTIVSICEEPTINLYFEYHELETSLIYIATSETTNFMLLETFESVGDY